MSYRKSYIHRRVEELGHPGLGEYFTKRWVNDKWCADDIAEECNVRANTVRSWLHRYGFEVNGRRRRKKPRARAGRNMICNSCGAGKYYSPAQLKKLDERTYQCISCRTVELKDVTAESTSEANS